MGLDPRLRGERGLDMGRDMLGRGCLPLLRFPRAAGDPEPYTPRQGDRLKPSAANQNSLSYILVLCENALILWFDGLWKARFEQLRGTWLSD